MTSELVNAIGVLSREKGVPKEVVIDAIESALVSAYRRNFNTMAQNVTAKLEPDTGRFHIYLEKEVVESLEVSDANHICLEEARALKPDAMPGDILAQEDTPPSLGRVAAQTAKQVVLQKLRDAERRRVYEEFVDREGEILQGVVQRIEQRTVYLDLGKAEAVMPVAEQVQAERYYPGQRLRVYVMEVNDSPKGPQIIVSRSHKMMLFRLFEQEVPEIFNGTVEIKAIAREAGSRSKVAVRANEEGVDPVGSCVGMRGVRIHNIVNELGGEKIDVIPWAPEEPEFVGAALSPAQVLSVSLNHEEKTATVVVPDKLLSLAIGKEGQNARLAAKLTGWRVDIKSDVPRPPDTVDAPDAQDSSSGPGGDLAQPSSEVRVPEEIQLDPQSELEPSSLTQTNSADQSE